MLPRLTSAGGVGSALSAVAILAAFASSASAQHSTSLRAVIRDDAEESTSVRMRSSFRSTARSNARGMAPEKTPRADKAKAVLSPSLTRSSQRELLPPKYMARFAGGKQRPIADYRDDGDSFWIQWVEGGHARYFKTMVGHIETLSDEQSATILAELQTAQSPDDVTRSTRKPAPRPVQRKSAPTGPRRYGLGPLRAEDFAGSPPKVRGRTLAYTYSVINYHYRYRTRVLPLGVQVLATEIETHATVDPARSWNLAPDDARLLDHEQGHFDITQLHTIHWQRQAAGLIGQAILSGQGANPQAAAQNLDARVTQEFSAVYEAWEAEQRRYDNETVHGSIRSRQDQWRSRLNAELEGKQLAPGLRHD